MTDRLAFPLAMSDQKRDLAQRDAIVSYPCIDTRNVNAGSPRHIGHATKLVDDACYRSHTGHHSEYRYVDNSDFRQGRTAVAIVNCATMTNSADFLSRAMAHAKLTNQSELSRRICTWLGKKTADHSLVNKVLMGKRLLKVDEIRAISAITGYTGHVTSGLQYRVPVVGFVTHGQKVVFLTKRSEAQMPEGAGPNTRAVEIRDDSLGSALNGWYAYYNENNTAPNATIERKLCVVCTIDGEIFVRKITAGRQPGLYSLWGSYGDPLLDVKLAWAEPVTAMLPSDIETSTMKKTA